MSGLTPPPIRLVPERESGFQLWPLRVRRPWMKVLFAAATLVVFRGVFFLPFPFDYVAAYLDSALAFGWWLLLARCLRAQGEPMNPPREWWRATYSPMASFAIAAVQSVLLVGAIVGAVSTAAAVRVLPQDWALLAFGLSLTILLIAFSVNSGVRMVRSNRSSAVVAQPGPASSR